MVLESVHRKGAQMTWGAARYARLLMKTKHAVWRQKLDPSVKTAFWVHVWFVLLDDVRIG